MWLVVEAGVVALMLAFQGVAALPVVVAQFVVNGAMFLFFFQALPGGRSLPAPEMEAVMVVTVSAAARLWRRRRKTTLTWFLKPYSSDFCVSRQDLFKELNTASARPKSRPHWRPTLRWSCIIGGSGATSSPARNARVGEQRSLTVSPPIFSGSFQSSPATRLHCYIVVDLKAVDFRPEFVGNMHFYRATVDIRTAMPSLSTSTNGRGTSCLGNP
jgi:hypothetical protein